MKTEQRHWTNGSAWSADASELSAKADIVFAFGSTEILSDKRCFEEMRRAYPKAYLLGCSTAGEILDTRVYDDSLALTAVDFESTAIKAACVDLPEKDIDSFQCGRKLADSIDSKDLTHAFVLSDGIHVNGSELVRGIVERLPRGVQLTGALAGDGTRFAKTVVMANAPAVQNRIALVGFYGKKLKVGYGSLGGWDPFGPDRLITRARSNILFELDNQPALTLYKTYLGEHAAGLPATGLLFPLSVRLKNGQAVVRTILGVNEQDQSMTFAGDVPEGSFARLMKANFDRLIDGAQSAARTSHEAIGASSPDLAILISCVGRKLVLQQRTEEVIEATRAVLGKTAALTGFYSYGEICPAAPNANCELHNQTMTITTFAER